MNLLNLNIGLILIEILILLWLDYLQEQKFKEIDRIDYLIFLFHFRLVAPSILPSKALTGDANSLLSMAKSTAGSSMNDDYDIGFEDGIEDPFEDDEVEEKYVNFCINDINFQER